MQSSLTVQQTPHRSLMDSRTRCRVPASEVRRWVYQITRVSGDSAVAGLIVGQLLSRRQVDRLRRQGVRVAMTDDRSVSYAPEAPAKPRRRWLGLVQTVD